MMISFFSLLDKCAMNASLLPNIQQLTIVFRDFEGLEQWGA
jgi:hypothetical protein